MIFKDLYQKGRNAVRMEESEWSPCTQKTWQSIVKELQSNLIAANFWEYFWENNLQKYFWVRDS